MVSQVPRTEILPDGEIVAYVDSLPAWMSYDDSTRTFSGTPDVLDVEEFVIQYACSDHFGATVTDSWVVKVWGTIGTGSVVYSAETSLVSYVCPHLVCGSLPGRTLRGSMPMWCIVFPDPLMFAFIRMFRTSTPRLLFNVYQGLASFQATHVSDIHTDTQTRHRTRKKVAPESFW